MPYREELFDHVGVQKTDRPRKKFWTHNRLLVAIVLVSLLLRLWAAWQLPVDADEPVYLKAASDYAGLIRAGDIGGVINYPGNPEHPPLVKLLYSVVFLLVPQGTSISVIWFLCRLVSVIFGVLAVWVLARENLLAGALLGVHTMTAKYTSEIYLEALPLFASLLAVFLLLKSTHPRDRRFWLSAAALGLAGAGKFSYFPILFVLLYIFLAEKKYSWKEAPLYLGAAALVFFVLNPALWPDPVSRLVYAVTFHTSYSQSAHVEASGYGFFQPLIWLFRSKPADWHPDVFFYIGFDEIIFLTALVGSWRLWKKQRWVVVWIAFGIIFLLLWPTKWPQYTLVVDPALCLAAALTINASLAWAREQEDRWGWFSAMFPKPTLAARIAAILFFGSIAVGAIVYWGYVSYNRIGWEHLTELGSQLPSSTVYDVQPLPDGRVAMGTAKGAALWYPADEENLTGKVDFYDPVNSGLLGNRVMAVAADDQGGLWFGTDHGLSYFDGTSWKSYSSADTGLGWGQVHALAVDDSGTVWAGTDQGLLAFEDGEWSQILFADPGSIDNFVMSLAATPGTNELWVGKLYGLVRLDTKTGTWEEESPPAYSVKSGGIADLMVDSSERLWVSTLGEGIYIHDHDGWSTISVRNSGLPYNIVQEVRETSPGVYWIGTAMPNEAGGVIARLENGTWKSYTSTLTGYSGSEVLSIATDAQGRIWFGTISLGVDIFSER